MPDQDQQKKPPKYSGQIQTVAIENGKRKKLGIIVLWENASKNPKAPVLTGKLFTKYGASMVSLWNYTPRKEQGQQGV